MDNTKLEAGNMVLHKPSGERWFLLGVNHQTGEVCVGGWPATIAKISDCELLEKGRPLTEEEVRYRDRQFGAYWE